MPKPHKHPAPRLYKQLDQVSLSDAARLRRRIHGLQRAKPETLERSISAIEQDLAKAAEKLQARVDQVPDVTLPDDLPITAEADTIQTAIENNQVVIVAGETGSGKTTQLPKLALRAGRGRRGLIGHTQPRRIAARSVATRIAQEMGTELGDHVGYSVRFTDATSDSTFIRLMTDGILLAEIGRDKWLSKYDTIIIDEAHERSLNIDFLIGYLTQLLPKRPDLKVIITSATIDVERFSEHFSGAPVIEVSGRTYPVDILYRPLDEYAEEDGEAADQITGIIEAARELCRKGRGDILVFLSGEREIRDAADALEGVKGTFAGPNVEITPLYARLSAAEQNKVFSTAAGRRIVLSTNVAETSLTVPGIRYVIDVGTARISRFSHRLKVQRLPIEPISQASANQRAGRCGRVADGVAIRLYSQQDFEARPEFTDPEILRTNLASVILTMSNVGLGRIADFPFLQPPEARHIADGVALLTELGALDAKHRITPLGKKMAALPIEPRVARMILAASERGCLGDVLTIAAALSIQDPRERPLEKQAQADTYHGRFRDKTSDFVSLLNLWDYLQEKQKEMGSSAFRRLCRSEFLNFVRIREWQDIRGQLQSLAKELKLDAGGARQHPDTLHTALLAGLLSHVGSYDETTKDYLGARGARFAIFPGSGLKNKRPDLIMSAELVETSRLWARDVAAIKPEWVEAVGEHMLKRSYSEPHWSKKQASVVASEKITLLGVVIEPGRTVQFDTKQPALARELFIRQGLVEGEWNTRHAFFHHNRALLDDAEEMQSRVRRRDLVVHDDELFAFYDERIPDSVVSGRHFDSWWKKASKRTPGLLNFSHEDILTDDSVVEQESAEFPRSWSSGDVSLPISYAFDPGTDRDGATVHIDISLLASVHDAPFDWHLPGHREELVTELLRTLPKPLRRHIVPIPDAAKKVLARLPQRPNERSIVANLVDALQAEYRLDVAFEDFDVTRLPDHLKLRFVVEKDGEELQHGTDLATLRKELGTESEKAVTAVTAAAERHGLETFPADIDLSQQVSHAAAGGAASVKGYFGIVDEFDAHTKGSPQTAALKVFATPEAAAAATPRGVTRLLLRDVGNPAARAMKNLDQASRLMIASAPYPSAHTVAEDISHVVFADVMQRTCVPQTADDYTSLIEAIRRDQDALAARHLGNAVKVLHAAANAANALPKSAPLQLAQSLADLQQWMSGHLVHGMFAQAGPEHLADLARYFEAAAARAEKLPNDPANDLAKLRQFQTLHDTWTKLRGRYDALHPAPPEIDDMRWMFEELRIHLFAQHIKTKHPVSPERVAKRLNQLRSQHL